MCPRGSHTTARCLLLLLQKWHDVIGYDSRLTTPPVDILILAPPPAYDNLDCGDILLKVTIFPPFLVLRPFFSGGCRMFVPLSFSLICLFSSHTIKFTHFSLCLSHLSFHPSFVSFIALSFSLALYISPYFSPSFLFPLF